ncbi:MAG: DUF1598 domain-containing protein [Planctomycetota bacterium]
MTKTSSDRLPQWLSVLVALVVVFGFSNPLLSQGIANVQSGGTQLFVTGVTPVIGPNGSVGGVSMDARSVIRLAEDVEQLRDRWIHPTTVSGEVSAEAELRVVSLRRLHEQMRRRLADEKPISEEMFFLAGLRRVEYLFADVERKDVLLAGPAGGWRSNGLGQTVSTKTGSPIVRLDDLAIALHSELTPDVSTSCSIEPTEAAVARFSNLRLRAGDSARASVAAMERALGTQQVLLTGVPRNSHLAAVMVAADYWMKRYAMGFDESPVKGMPSYMTLLQRRGTTKRVTSPRWWMGANYESLSRSPDGLVWRLQGQGVRTLTQDAIFNSRGQRVQTGEKNALAEQWADTMTESYEALSRQRPIFGELRNCFDLSVMAALVAHHGLLDLSECELPLLLDSGSWRPEFKVPTGIPSQGSLVRARRGWLVSISGGVDIQTTDVIGNWKDEPSVRTEIERPYPSDETRWWW